MGIPDSGHNSKLTVLRSRSRSRLSGHGPHTPRVTVGVPDSGHNSKLTVLWSKSRSWLSGHGTHTPRVTVGVPDSGHNSKLTILKSWSISSSKYSSLLSQSHCNQVSVTHSISRKKRNKIIKQKNGNGKNSLSICHWNLGSKKWKNKRNQIQALVDSNNCDLIFISEANLDKSTPTYESLITGYKITLPKTVIRNGTARLVLLTRENLKFELVENLMDDTFSSIWVKISRQGIKSLMVCGLYREHQYLAQDNDWSLHPTEQTRRWTNFLRQVESARISSTCHLIGDFNLDYKKWTAPDFTQAQMITDTKNSLEGGGFFQMVNGITRTWPGQVDSLIDHFWTNDPQKIISISNSVRAAGDHNVITAVIRMKGSATSKLDTRKRSYKIFDPYIYRQRLESENWSDIYDIEDVDLANNFIESRVANILDSICPYKTIQYRTDCKSWLTDDTKNQMKTRDLIRERARISGDPDLWSQYKSLRNKVNKLVNSDRKTYYDKMYECHHDNKDVGATYRTAKNQAGLKKNTSPTNFLHDGRKITDPQEMADIMLKTFSDKTEQLKRELPPPTIDPCATLLESLDKWGPKKDARKSFEFETITNMDTLAI